MANEGNLEPRTIPLRSRLFWYELTAGELLVLHAYVEHSRDGDGKTLWASVPRIAAYTNLSVSQVQRIIGAGPKGDGKDKHGKLIAGGLVARKILLPTARAKPTKMHSASYTLNEAALKMKPKILEYLDRDRQRTLPGIHVPTRHGEPIRDEKPTPPGRTMRPGYLTLQPSAQSGESRPLVAPCDQGNDGHLVAPCDQGDNPGINSDATPWSHHATSLVAPCDQPGRTMRPDPTSYLLRSISLKDSSVLKDSGNTSSTSLEIPIEIKNGLREILPDLDERAIKQLWLGCKGNAPDCTVEEVLHFAWTKVPALNKADNPAGLLIHAVPQCFEGGESSALAHFRHERQKQQQRDESQQRQQAQEALAEEDFQRQQDERRRELEQALAQMPEEELQSLEGETRAEFRELAPYMPADALESQIRTVMLGKLDGRPRNPGFKPWRRKDKSEDVKPPP